MARHAPRLQRRHEVQRPRHAEVLGRPAAVGVDGDGDDDPDAGPAPEPGPLAQAQAARDDYLDQLQRARADYDNLNKRRHKEVAEARDRGQAALVEGLLEVLDTFGFALRAAEDAQPKRKPRARAKKTTKAPEDDA